MAPDKNQHDDWDDNWLDIDSDPIEFVDINVDSIDPNDVLTNGDVGESLWERL